MASATVLATKTQEFISHYVVQPLLILFLGIFFGKLLEQLIVFLAKEFKKDTPEIRFTARVLAWIIYIVALALALRSLSILRVVSWFLIGATVVVLSVSLILSLKDFFPNFLAYSKVKAKYKPQGTMKTKFGEMTVVKVQLIDTHLQNAKGEMIYMPNRIINVGNRAFN